MGDTIKLSIEIQGREEAIASLSDIDKLADKLRKKPITIPVEKSAARDIEETASDLGKLAKETETFINQEEKASKLTQTFKNGVGQVTTVVKQLNKETKAYDETLKTTTKDYEAQEKAARKAAETAAKAAAKLAENRRIGEGLWNDILGTEEANRPDTAMQKRINDMVGLSGATKSAAESAEVFKLAFATEDRAAGLDLRLSNMANSVATISDKYEPGTFTEIGNGIANTRTQLATLNDQYRRGEISVEQYAEGVNNLSGETKTLATQFANAKGEGDKLVETADNLFDKLLKIGKAAAVAALVKSFKDALGTMKEVDSELINIQKITNASDSEIKALGEDAYDTATKYGVAATDFLSAAADFTKAGYENYEAMAELSTKTQLVGDVNAEVASKFLIAADAAYKMGGNISELNSLLDSANYIENNYATSIEKIAEGFPNVASTAANARVSVEELTAALGTITAATQESGSQASRALRALFLNIQGEVGAVIDDDLTVTQESVDSITDALKMYAPEVVKAAQATGQLIDPMEAVAALSKAFREGQLNEIELADILSSIGGKLRTNQLTALVKNFDKYEEMLEGVKHSAGSADQEVSVMLESWNAKTEQLRNTWTRFVEHLIETDTIKGGIDFLRGAIEFLDNDIAQAAISGAALGKALSLIANSNAAKSIYDLSKNTLGAVKSFDDLRAAAELLKESVIANPVFAGAAAVIGITLFIKYCKKLNEAYGEQLDIVEKLNQEEKDRFGEGSEYDRLTNARRLTEEEQNRLIVLKQQKAELDAQIKAEAKLAYEQRRARGGTTVTFETNRGLTEGLNNAKYVSDPEERVAVLEDLVEEYKEEYDELKLLKEAGADLSDTEKALIEKYEAASGEVKRYRDAHEQATEAVEEAKKAEQERISDLTTLQDELEGATAAIQKFKDATKEEKGDAFSGYADMYKAYLEDWEAGKHGSNAAKAAIEGMLSPEVLSSMGYDYEKAGEMLSEPFWRAVFSAEGKDYGATFAAALYEMADANGELRNSAGEVVASFEEVDGSLSMTYTSMDDLAEMFGVTPELIAAIVDGLDIYDTSLAMGTKDTAELAEKLRETAGVADGAKLSIQQVVDGLVAAGETDKQKIRETVDALLEANEVDASGVENLDGTIGNIIDTSVDAADKLGDVKDAADSIPEKVETKVSADVTEATIKLTNILNLLERIGRTSPTVRVNSNATGTKNSPGGLSLVNDGGGPELIVDNGEAYIANGGAPAVVNLSPGAQVYTAEETEKALNGGSKTRVFNSYALGNIPYKKNGVVGSGSGGSRISSSTSNDFEKLEESLSDILKNLDLQAELALNRGNPGGAVTAYGKAIAEINGMIEKYRAAGYSDTSTEILELENQLYDYADDIEDVYDDLEGEIEDAVKAAYNDYKDIVKQQTDAIDAQIDALKAEKDAAKERNELEEKQLAVLEAEKALWDAQAQRTVRVYNAKTGQWEWVANQSNVASAQEKLTSAQQDYADYLSEKAYQEQVDALEALKDELKNTESTYKDEMDRVLGTLDPDVRELTAVLSDLQSAGSDGDYSAFADYVESISRAAEGVPGTVNTALAAQSGMVFGGVNTSVGGGIIPTTGTGSDSHDTIYSFPGGINLSEAQARTTTVAELADQLRVLGIS